MKKCLCLLLSLCFLALPGCVHVVEPFDLSETRIRQDTELLCTQFPARVTGTDEERAACDWLEGQLNASGFSVENKNLSCVAFEGLDGLTSENLIAVSNADPALPLVSIVTHYDSYPGTPGAGDNAAGVAVLLEIARYLHSSELPLACEIRMVFLGSEENGYHGSLDYVDSLSQADRARHLGAYNMDISAAMLGAHAQLVCCTLGGFTENGYQAGNFLEPIENAVSRSVATAYGQLYGNGYGGVCSMGESDHMSFHNQKLEAANICWRQMDDGLPQLPSTYHRAADVPETLDYRTARTTGRCILKAIQLLTERI